MSFRLAVLTLAALGVISCGNEPPRVTYIGGTEHFPLRDGRLMRYRQIEDGDTAVYSVSFRYIGGRAHKLFSAQVTAIGYGGLEFRSHGNSVQAAMQASPTSLFSRSKMGEFRQVWIDEDVAPDSSWIDEDTGTETFVLDYNDVAVPAGNFENCYVTEIAAVPELQDSIRARRDRNEINSDQFDAEMAAAKVSIFRWFAPGVGMVREQIGDNLVRELLSVDSLGTGIPDTLPLETTTQIEL